MCWQFIARWLQSPRLLYLITLSSRQWDILGSSCCSFTGQTHFPSCGNNSNICAALRDDSTFFKKKKIILNNFQLKKKNKTWIQTSRKSHLRVSWAIPATLDLQRILNQSLGLAHSNIELFMAPTFLLLSSREDCSGEGRRHPSEDKA